MILLFSARRLLGGTGSGSSRRRRRKDKNQNPCFGWWWGILVTLKGKNTVSQPKTVFLPCKEQKQPTTTQSCDFASLCSPVARW